jgi:predicted transcriptional regulator
MNTRNKVQIHVDGLKEMESRFIQAWHRAEAGEDVQENHVTFLDMQALLDALTPRRLELLRHVRQHAVANTKELSEVLGRNYKNVHQDVVILEGAGLLVREGRKLYAPWDELQTNVSLLVTD